MEEEMLSQQVDESISKLFLARFAAFKKLGSNLDEERNAARKFLLETMTQSEVEYDFPLKESFVRSISAWQDPIIVAVRMDDDVNAVVYKIPCKMGDKDMLLHEISFFSKIENNRYFYTHKYDLAKLRQEYCLQQETYAGIRLIGDPVLQREATDMTDQLTDLTKQLQIMQQALTKTGGVGIAANQCANIADPLKIILVGVDYHNPEHVVKALTRYPTTLFPQMIICLNPKIIESSPDTESFVEGCLSVQGIFRGSVKRSKTVTVNYLDLNARDCEKQFSGSDARVMLHELDHILNGQVYMQRIIDELSDSQLLRLQEIVMQAISNTSKNEIANSFNTPVLVFERLADGSVDFDDDVARECFSKTREDVLQGISAFLHTRIKSSTQSLRK